MYNGQGMISRRILYVAAVCAVMYAGCDALFGPDSGPNAPQFSPPGGTYTQQQYVSVTGTGGSVYVSGDPDALLADFEPAPDTILVPDDIVLRAFTIDDRGVRSPLSEASYIISDSTAPQIQSSGIHQDNVSYREFTITWDVSEPDANGASNPSDDATDWYNLEFALFASTRNNIDTIDDALQNGTLVKDWHAQVTSSVGSAEYQTSLAGETVYVNVFVRDRSGNTSGYGTVEMSTPPALDIYVGSFSPVDIFDDEIWMNPADDDPNPTFDPGWAPSVPLGLEDTYGVALADLTGDGYDDLIACFDEGGTVYQSWFEAQGNGRFDPASRVNLKTGSEIAYDITVADINQDGALDIIFANSISDDVEIYETDGSLLATVAASGTDRVSVGEFNGDGLPDLATFNLAPPDVALWVNTSGSSFTEAVQSWGGETVADPTDVLLTDLDGDGDSDLVVASNLGKVELYYSDGATTFTPETNELDFWSARGTVRLAAADWNQDGHVDLILGTNSATYGQDTALFLSDGAGEYLLSDTAPTGISQSQGLIVADLNGDGWDDVVEVVSGVGYHIWLNDTAGGINAGHSPGTPFGTLAVGRLR